MPLPLAAALPIAGAGLKGLFGLIGARSNQPVRPRRATFSLPDMLKLVNEDALRTANAGSANQGTLVGQRLAAKGMQNSTLGNTMLKDVQEQNYGRAWDTTERARLPLLQQKSRLDEDYNRRMEDYDRERGGSREGLFKFFGDLLGTAGQLGGGALEAGKQDQMARNREDEEFETLMEYLRTYYGGGSQPRAY